MSYPCLKNNRKRLDVLLLALVVVFVFSGRYAYAGSFFKLGEFFKSKKPSSQPVNPAPENKTKSGEDLLLESKLTQLQIMAREYRQEGLILQRSGDFEGARTFYEKAIAADPYYAPAYNDLGVIFEIAGDLDTAQTYYLKSTQVDPGYLSGYSNLAMLFEYRRDLKTAAAYWQKRAELGSPDDPWTQKAFGRLNDIRQALGEKIDTYRERKILQLVGDIADRKEIIREDDSSAAQMYFQKAKNHYKRGDNVTALKEAISAMQLDPQNDEIVGFVEKVQLRLLSK